MKILATTGNQHSSLKLISMNGYSYKIISGNKCLYEYERKANAVKKWQELTGKGHKMINTNSELFKQRLRAHILEHFSPENYDSTTTDPLANLRGQLDSMRYNNKITGKVALEYMEGGGMLVYYGDARDFLQEMLEQTDEQAAKYDNETVWHTYCHTMALQMARLYTDGDK